MHGAVALPFRGRGCGWSWFRQRALLSYELLVMGYEWADAAQKRISINEQGLIRCKLPQIRTVYSLIISIKLLFLILLDLDPRELSFSNSTGGTLPRESCGL